VKFITNSGSCDWAVVARKFGYADVKKFAWATVSIQRSIVLGAISVRDDNLGEFLMQYGRYLNASNGHGSQPFKFSRSGDSLSIPKVTFRDITTWILTSSDDSSARLFAKCWDNAVQLNLIHRKSMTLPDWDNFLKAAAKLQIKK
jgi:hypothetical protein